jgi:hypothetical protein
MRMRTIYEDIQYDEWDDCVIVIGDDITVMQSACDASDLRCVARAIIAMLVSLTVLFVVAKCMYIALISCSV